MGPDLSYLFVTSANYLRRVTYEGRRLFKFMLFEGSQSNIGERLGLLPDEGDGW